MRTLSTLVPDATDRALIVGMTGSGKTVLAQYLCEYRANVVVLDPKRRIEWPGYQLHKTLKNVTRARETRLIYRPSHDAMRDWEHGDDEINRFFEWVFRRGATTLYVDETYMVTRGEEMPRFYHACLTQGRELGIETWSATQRPKQIPQVVMSEAEHVYAFRLNMPQDRLKLEQMTAIRGDDLRSLPKYYFLYANQGSDPSGPYTLNLETAKA